MNTSVLQFLTRNIVPSPRKLNNPGTNTFTDLSVPFQGEKILKYQTEGVALGYYGSGFQPGSKMVPQSNGLFGVIGVIGGHKTGQAAGL